jgi:hypothetical protein
MRQGLTYETQCVENVPAAFNPASTVSGPNETSHQAMDV